MLDSIKNKVKYKVDPHQLGQGSLKHQEGQREKQKE